MEDRRKRGVLGRGLSALLGDEGDVAFNTGGDGGGEARSQTMVPVEFLQSGRFQPRTQFDQEALNDLADSIREKGIIQPILVRILPEDSNRYEIIAGERRWRAAQIAQLHTVPVIVREFSDRDAAEVALVENLQRRDLSPLEEAEGYRRLQEEFQHTQDDLSKAVGKSRSHVANMIRLLALPDPVKDMMRTGTLTAGHARALLNADDPGILAEQVVKKGLNVRQTEKLATEKGGVKARKARPETAEKAERSPAVAKDTDTLALERDLARVLGLKVNIEFEGRGGRVVIHYSTLEQLDDILYRLNNPTDNAADRRREALEAEHAADEMADQAFAAVFAAKPVPAPEEEASGVAGVTAADLLADATFEDDLVEDLEALEDDDFEDFDFEEIEKESSGRINASAVFSAAPEDDAEEDSDRVMAATVDSLLEDFLRERPAETEDPETGESR